MTYDIREGYTARDNPAYFSDDLPDSLAWQSDVYRIAAHLAEAYQASALIDLGCGRGGKLVQYADQLPIVGIDYGLNIAHCYQTHRGGQWINKDFEKNIIHPETFRDSIVICADVLEHLINPDLLIASLRNAVMTAHAVLISTPDRLRVYGGEQDGPPENPFHCREWTAQEFVAYLRGQALPLVWSGWTISNSARPDKNTTLVIASRQHPAVDLSDDLTNFDVEPMKDAAHAL